MKAITSTLLVGLFAYSCAITKELFAYAHSDAESLQYSLALEKRVEELMRTRYGAVDNYYQCKLRGD